MKALVFAGDPAPSQNTQATPASFLRLEGRPLLLYVLVALDGVKAIDEIEVFGPQKEIMKVLENALPHFLFSKTIRVQTQAFQPAHHLLSDVQSDDSEGDDALKMLSAIPSVLMLPGNIPLLTPGEIEAFLSKANLSNYDFALGLCKEDDALPKSASMHTVHQFKIDGKAFRASNMVLARSLTKDSPFFNKEDDRDKGQSKTNGNIELFTKGGETKSGTHCFSSLLETWLDDELRKKIETLSQNDLILEKLEESIQKHLNIKINIVLPEKGYSAISIENELEIEVLGTRLNDWREDLLALSKTEGQACPFSGDAC